jgi:hypothetical protein
MGFGLAQLLQDLVYGPMDSIEVVKNQRFTIFLTTGNQLVGYALPKGLINWVVGAK